MAITDKMLQISNKSYINKDFQTIYPELIDLFNELTNRYDPSASNESDPMVVFLKLLGFLGDKLSYNTDKSALETALYSATQETSVREITDVNGYNMRYYTSATTPISVMYNGEVGIDEIGNFKKLKFKAFDTQFTNEDGDIVYTLIEDLEIADRGKTKTATVAQGVAVDLEINGNKSIQLNNLDDNNRLYFPVQLVAENLVFVKNDDDSDAWDEWKRVDNLNIYKPMSKVFKFGFDSYQNLPYIQFPEDVVEMIDNGFNVKYFETDGVNGNIPAKQLSVLKEPSESSLYYYNENNEKTDELVPIQDDITGTKLLVILNNYSATNGQNPETIDEAISNYQKVIGTFDTLITCRDYANWLYRQTESITDESYVSNIQVSDRRDDINYSVPIISYNKYGVTTSYKFLQVDSQDAITPFDLVLYPLRKVYNMFKLENYKNTFKKTEINKLITEVLRDAQCISHTFLKVNEDPAVNFKWGKYLIKNYYKLNAKISTNYKVNDIERREIEENVRLALYKNFNSRMLDYGEEIPYETLLKVMESADERIKFVSLDEPTPTTWVLPASDTSQTDTNPEYALLDDTNGVEKYYYLDMVARNVLAGKISLFEYDNDFNYQYGQTEVEKTENMYSIFPQLEIKNSAFKNNFYKLKKNQAVQLLAPNFTDSMTATVGVKFLWISSNTIGANNEYKLTGSDVLYLSATDTNDVTKTYKYTNDRIEVLDVNGNTSYYDEVNENVIKPSFELKQSYDGRVTSGVNTDRGTLQFYSLTANETITTMKRAMITLDANNIQTIKCYWFMNNPEDRLFDTSEGQGPWEVVLGENEHFFYTDTSMASVEVFGSGTRLTTNIKDKWEIDTSTLISIDEFNASNSANFSNIKWKDIQFTNDEYIKVEEMNILTLIEGDEFKVTSNSFTDDLTHEMIPLALANNDKFIYITSDGTEGDLPLSVAGESWKIRTRLDLNLGPNLGQQVKGETGVFTEKFYVEYYDQTTHTITPLVSPISALTTSNKFIKLNLNLQRTGNNKTYLYVINDEKGTNEVTYPYTLLEYSLNDADLPKFGDNDAVFDSDNYTSSPLSDIVGEDSSSGSVVLKVPTQANETSYVFVYWDNVSEGVQISASLSAGTLTNLNNQQSNLLQNGVNVLAITSSSSTVTLTLNITNAQGSSDSIVIEQVKLAKGYNPAFGLVNTTEINQLIACLNELINIDEQEDNQFYYTHTVTNADAIELDDTLEEPFKSPYVLWDKNNVYNKFTLAEIDFDSSNIAVVKSSRLS